LISVVAAIVIYAGFGGFTAISSFKWPDELQNPLKKIAH
jgi:hypothetical protein